MQDLTINYRRRLRSNFIPSPSPANARVEGSGRINMFNCIASLVDNTFGTERIPPPRTTFVVTLDSPIQPGKSGPTYHASTAESDEPIFEAQPITVKLAVLATG